EPVQPPARHVAENKRRRAAPADALRAAHRLGEKGDVEVRVPAAVVREPGPEERVLELWGVGHRDRGAVQARALPTDGREGLLANRVVYETEQQLVAAREGDRDGEVRIAVDEIGRPVERIDVPAVARLGGSRRG